MRILSVASELFPLVKTGGLADVAGALPLALGALGCEVQSLVPAYPQVRGKLEGLETVAELGDLMGGPGRLLAGRAGGLGLFLVEAPHLFERAGSLYQDPAGHDWPDNDRRFAALAWAAREIGFGILPGWRPDLVHAHDWQAGLAPAYLALAGGPRPATVVTVHNLAFQGQFDAHHLATLRLPPDAYRPDGVEYYGSIGFLKAGLFYADRLTTVSPTYAREIQTAEEGMGLDGLLRLRAGELAGIVNGIDTEVWDPAADPHLAQSYTALDRTGKASSKTALQARLGLEQDPASPLFGVVSRLTWQKGMDLLLSTLPLLLAGGGQLAVLGSGEPRLEAGFAMAAAAHPGRVGVVIGYDEALSHLIQGGADAILVPSRFEPCGLTQLIGLRYGTAPVVARVGGLADTVIDANEAAIEDGVATGLQFAPVTAEALGRALARTIELFRTPAWDALVRRAMTREVGWARPARHYQELYRGLLGAG